MCNEVCYMQVINRVLLAVVWFLFETPCSRFYSAGILIPSEGRFFNSCNPSLESTCTIVHVGQSINSSCRLTVLLILCLFFITVMIVVSILFLSLSLVFYSAVHWFDQYTNVRMNDRGWSVTCVCGLFVLNAYITSVQKAASLELSRYSYCSKSLGPSAS